jgi:hypothetical protein
MAIPRGYGLNGKSLYTNVTKPMETYLTFTVDSANVNGLGVRSVKSNGYVDSVYMHTTATPAPGSPNPIAGYALVTFRNNFNFYLNAFDAQTFPLTSTAQTSTTTGNPYVITSLGTTTLAQWLAAGTPEGITPAVGTAFIAEATGAIGGTGTVGSPGSPVAPNVSIVGDPNQTITNLNVALNAGAQILLQFSSATTPTAPADGTVVNLTFCYDGSQVTIDGL